MRSRICVGVLAASAALGPATAGEWWQNQSDAQDRLSADCPYLHYAISIVESQRFDDANGSRIRPHAYTLRSPDGAYWPDDRAEAVEILSDYLDRGETLVDVGPYQINLHWHGHRISEPEALFSPATAQEVVTQILTETLASAPEDPALGVGRYHSWRTEPARKYGERVLRLRHSLIEHSALDSGTEVSRND